MSHCLEELVSNQETIDSLIACNVNLQTGFATNYLNHYFEIVLLFELLPDVPECVEEIEAWAPMTYCDHVTASNLKNVDLILTAYEAASEESRQTLSMAVQIADIFILDLKARALKSLADNDHEGVRRISMEAGDRGRAIMSDLNRIVQFGRDATEPFMKAN